MERRDLKLAPPVPDVPVVAFDHEGRAGEWKFDGVKLTLWFDGSYDLEYPNLLGQKGAERLLAAWVNGASEEANEFRRLSFAVMEVKRAREKAAYREASGGDAVRAEAEPAAGDGGGGLSDVPQEPGGGGTEGDQKGADSGPDGA